MVSLALETKVRQAPGVALIDLRGDIDGTAEEALEHAYARAEQHDPAAILLNFSQVAYINSKGLALIVLLLRRALAADRQLVACCLSDHYLEIWTITRLADYIAVYPDEPAALANIRSPASVQHTGRADHWKRPPDERGETHARV